MKYNPRIVKLLFFLLFALWVSDLVADEEPHLLTGKASYYADIFQGADTASGEPYDRAELTGAHPTLPYGTIVKVTRVDNGSEVIVRINDRGPHTRGRVVDLSRAAAEAIGLVEAGVAEVTLEVLEVEVVE